jgi:hypothetical protein
MPKKGPSAPTTAPDYGFERDAEPLELKVRIAAAAGAMAIDGIRAGIDNLRDPSGVENALVGMVVRAGFTENDPLGVKDSSGFSRKDAYTKNYKTVHLKTDETSNTERARVSAPVDDRAFHDNAGLTSLLPAVSRLARGEFKEQISGVKGLVIRRAARYLVKSGVVGKIESSRSDRLGAAKKKAKAVR